MGVEIELFEIGAYFLQNELPLLLEEVPLAERMRMVFQHDGAPAHYSRLVTHHLNLTFPNDGSPAVVTFNGHQSLQKLLI
jgi:hypothetical protein